MNMSDIKAICKTAKLIRILLINSFEEWMKDVSIRTTTFLPVWFFRSSEPLKSDIHKDFIRTPFYGTKIYFTLWWCKNHKNRHSPNGFLIFLPSNRCRAYKSNITKILLCYVTSTFSFMKNVQSKLSLFLKYVLAF